MSTLTSLLRDVPIADLLAVARHRAARCEKRVLTRANALSRASVLTPALMEGVRRLRVAVDDWKHAKRDLAKIVRASKERAKR